MAIFQGEDLVDVTAADGRTLKVPRSLASMMPGQAQPPQQQIVNAPPVTDEVAGTGMPFEIPAVTGGQLPSQEQQLTPPPAPVVNGPDQVVKTVPGMGDKAAQKFIRADDAKIAKQQKQQAAYQASPQGKLDAAQAQSTAADQSVEGALLNQADVEGAEQDMQADAVTERNKQLDDLFAKRATDMQAAAEAEDAKMNEIVGLRKKIASTKVDRSLDHPIALAISAALVGLGQTMQGQKVDVMGLITGAIDRKVAAQESDLDKMAKAYGMTREELGDLKEKSKRKLEFHNAMIAAETDRAVRQLEEITARSASEKTKANAKMLIAQLQQRAADKTMEATRWGLDYDQKDKHQKQQIQLGYAGIAQQRYATDLGAQIDRERIAADLAKALANDKANGDAATYKARLEADKEARTAGVRDMNGDYYLTPAAKQQMEQAQALEAQADQLESSKDPMARSIASDKIALLRQKASILRGDAQSFGVVKAHSDTEAVNISNMLSSGQSVVQLIDEIKQISDKAGRGLISRDQAQVELKSKFNLMKPGLKEAWQLGAWDKGAGGLVESIIGADPSSDWNADVLGALVAKKMIEDPKAFQKGLDSVAEDLDRKAKNKLVNLGVKFGQGETALQRAAAAPPPSASAVNLMQAPSGNEIAASNEQAGTVAKIGRAGYQAIIDKNAPSHAQEAEQSQSTKYVGLSNAQVAPFEERLRAYKAGDKNAGDELVGIVAEAAAKRPGLAVPLLQNLQQYGGKTLYAAARAAVPAGSETDKIMSQGENNRIGASAQYQANPQLFITGVLGSIDNDGNVTDHEGAAELARRAGQKDPLARKAILDIANARAARKNLPPGSVFRGGQ